METVSGMAGRERGLWMDEENGLIMDMVTWCDEAACYLKKRMMAVCV